MRQPEDSAVGDASALFALPRALLLFAAFATLVLIVNRAALDAWFAADDFLWLEIGNLHDVARSFVGGWGHGAVWRPLSRVSFYVDDLLFGLDAGPWHLESLLWHATGTTLLALLLARVSGRPVLAVVAATIFALLPLHYENTMWISARSHLISFATSMAALLAVDRHLRVPSRRNLIAAALFLTVGLLTYEAAVYTLPLAGLVVLAHGRPLRLGPAFAALATVAGITALYLFLRPIVLGGETLYAPRPLGQYLTWKFARQLGEAASMLVGQLAPTPWAAWLAAAILAARTAPGLARVGAFGLAVIAIGYAPFAIVDGLGPRFLYAAQAGLAIVLAATLAALWELPRAGKAIALTLLALLLHSEVVETRQIASEWRDAGVAGRITLERLTRAWRDPDPDRPAVIVGAPTGLGRAMIFYTYFDLALGTFSPRHAGLRIPGHLLTDFSPGTSRALLGYEWQREQDRRARRGLAPLVCASGDPNAAADVDGFVKALADCDAVFYAISKSGVVRRMPRPLVDARLARGWRTPWS